MGNVAIHALALAVFGLMVLAINSHEAALAGLLGLVAGGAAVKADFIRNSRRPNA
jgi:hypothetical protein